MKKVFALLLLVCILIYYVPSQLGGVVAYASSEMCVIVPGVSNYDAIAKVVEGTNAIRASVGAGPLSLDANLTELAMQRAAESAINCSHTRPNGEQCYTVTSNGITFDGTFRGENLAAGMSTAEKAVEGWRTSSGHYKTMTEKGFTRIGVGSFTNNGITYWIQLFANGTLVHSPYTLSERKSERRTVWASQSMLSPYLNQSSVECVVGNTVDLPRVYTHNASVPAYLAVLESSVENSAPSVGRVQAKDVFTGLHSLTGISGGTGILTINSGLGDSIYSVDLPYRVIQPAISLDLTSLELQKGESATIIASVTPPSYSIGWTSTNNSVATVRNGTVTAVGSGEADITASLSLYGSTYSASCHVSVTQVGQDDEDPPITNPSEIIPTGVQIRSTLSIEVRSFGILWETVLPENATNQRVIWESSDPTVATVDEVGVVTGVNPGSAVITVTTVSGGKQATCFVTVVEDIKTGDGQGDSGNDPEPGKDPTPDIQDVILPFDDVSSFAYYYDPVVWAVGNHITEGTSKTSFSPNRPCTRAQAVTFLWRAAGSPGPSSSYLPFRDVQRGSYYEKAVLWALENGVTGGTSASTFSPNSPCTRAQIVTFLYRMAGSPSVNGSTGFADVKPEKYYEKAVVWAVQNRITEGTTASTFSPDDNCTRAQIVTFLHRYYQV